MVRAGYQVNQGHHRPHPAKRIGLAHGSPDALTPGVLWLAGQVRWHCTTFFTEQNQIPASGGGAVKEVVGFTLAALAVAN